VERVGAQDGLRRAAGDHAADPVRAVGGDVGEFRGPAGSEAIEEGLQGLAVVSGRGPDEQPAVVVDDDDQVLMAAFIGDLVDSDAVQPGEPVGGCLGLGGHPGDDVPDGAPGDPHQLSDRGLRARGGQPGDLVIEEPGVSGAVPGPRHGGHHHPVLGAGDPRRGGFQLGPHRAQVQRPPPAPALPLVIAGALLPADPAPAGQPLARPHAHGHRQLPRAVPGFLLIPVHALDHGVLAAEHSSP
jgi:hypothetical protein